jgi:signal transduction histidine kinase
MDWQIEQYLQSGMTAILDAFGDAISIQDADLKVIYQNSRHVELMGDHRGKYCYEGYQNRDTACPDCHLLTAFREGRPNSRVVTTQHSRRGLMYVEIISSPLKNEAGTIVAGIETVRDITERKLMDEKYKAITCDLEQKSWKLMATNKELESFSYTLSHDIRNYISRISIAADALTSVAAPSLDETGRFLLGSITESCSAMDEMIEAILRLSVTGQGGVVEEEVELGSVAQELAKELQCQYPDHSVEFTTAAGLVARGDSQLLKVMLRNLLANAWKYTQGVSAASVSFVSEEHEGKKVFVVRDNGTGFDMQEAGRLFKPFSRLSNSTGINGAGIGLATVRRIILSHGGEVWAEGAPGKGATFYFTLPVPEK